MVTCYDFCSGIQIQRSSDSNMDRLAGLGIQVSRSAEERPPPAASNDLNRLSKLGISVSSSQPDSGSQEVQSRLTGLGVSVSGGPKPPATNAAASRLPPGISVSGGPSPVKNLPPGVSLSGGPSPSKPPAHPTARAPPNLPPGVSVSGGARPSSNGDSCNESRFRQPSQAWRNRFDYRSATILVSVGMFESRRTTRDISRFEKGLGCQVSQT